MSPVVAGSAPERTLMSVDLPAPLSPTNPTISFLSTVKSTLSRAFTLPKNLLIPSMRTSSSAILSLPKPRSSFQDLVNDHHEDNNKTDENVIRQARYSHKDDP